MHIRDRVVELHRIKASELLPNPKNWRRHPDAQADVMRGMLAEIGYADALLARRVEGGFMLIDGHLRAETTPDEIVPVLEVNLTDEEADKLLATLDPLASMATTDADLYADLLASLDFESGAARELVEAVLARAQDVDVEAFQRLVTPNGSGGVTLAFKVSVITTSPDERDRIKALLESEGYQVSTEATRG